MFFFYGQTKKGSVEPSGSLAREERLRQGASPMRGSRTGRAAGLGRSCWGGEGRGGEAVSRRSRHKRVSHVREAAPGGSRGGPSSVRLATPWRKP